LRESSEVTIRIYSVTGDLLRKLDLGYKPAGVYVSPDRAAHWDGRNESGEKVTSGIYFCLMEAGSFTATKKIVISR
jgi:flagellar hook assembly protein FlgD